MQPDATRGPPAVVAPFVILAVVAAFSYAYAEPGARATATSTDSPPRPQTSRSRAPRPPRDRGSGPRGERARRERSRALSLVNLPASRRFLPGPPWHHARPTTIRLPSPPASSPARHDDPDTEQVAAERVDAWRPPGQRLDLERAQHGRRHRGHEEPEDGLDEGDGGEALCLALLVLGARLALASVGWTLESGNDVPPGER